MTNPAKAAAPVHPRRKRKKHWLQRDWRLYLMLLIPIVWYILFCYKPMAGLQIAFQKYNMFNPAKSRWIWLDNFKFVFGMSDFGIALKNTLILNGLDLLFGFPVPIILAILLNEMRTPMLKKFRRRCCTCRISSRGSSSAAWCCRFCADVGRHQLHASALGLDFREHSFPDGWPDVDVHLCAGRRVAVDGLGHDSLPCGDYRPGHEPL